MSANEQRNADRVILETTINFGSFPPSIEDMNEEMGHRDSNVYAGELPSYRNVTELDLQARLHCWDKLRLARMRRHPDYRDVNFDMSV